VPAKGDRAGARAANGAPLKVDPGFTAASDALNRLK